MAALNKTSTYATTAKFRPDVRGTIGVTDDGEVKVVVNRGDGVDELTLFTNKANTTVRPVLFSAGDRVGLTYMSTDSTKEEARICTRELDLSNGVKASDSENCVSVNLVDESKSVDCGGAIENSPYESIHRFIMMQNAAIIGVIVLAIAVAVVLIVILFKRRKR